MGQQKMNSKTYNKSSLNNQGLFPMLDAFCGQSFTPAGITAQYRHVQGMGGPGKTSQSAAWHSCRVRYASPFFGDTKASSARDSMEANPFLPLYMAIHSSPELKAP